MGCGWLGTAIAAALRPFLGYAIQTSTTTGGDHHIGLQLPLPDSVPASILAFFECDVLVITVPFRRNLSDPWLYPAMIETIRPFLQQHSHVIFTSSTTVYNKNDRCCDESIPISPDTDRAAALCKTEENIRQWPVDRYHILRLGGLYGPGREPGRFFKNSHQKPLGKAPVNMVHQYDVVAIISQIIATLPASSTWNVVSTNQPSKRIFYTEHANRLGVHPPSFDNREPTIYKKVSANRLVKQLGYVCRY